MFVRASKFTCIHSFGSWNLEPKLNVKMNLGLIVMVFYSSHFNVIKEFMVCFKDLNFEVVWKYFFFFWVTLFLDYVNTMHISVQINTACFIRWGNQANTSHWWLALIFLWMQDQDWATMLSAGPCAIFNCNLGSIFTLLRKDGGWPGLSVVLPHPKETAAFLFSTTGLLMAATCGATHANGVVPRLPCI